jgi:hypothetical protein
VVEWTPKEPPTSPEPDEELEERPQPAVDETRLLPPNRCPARLREVLPLLTSARYLARSRCQLLAAQVAPPSPEPHDQAICQFLSVPVRSRMVLAMQKVEGSSPFIRSMKPPQTRGFLARRKETHLRLQAELQA